MADTRINALSTATVSLSDDYLPIDGTTAGTKKLSAYSPSFGGNATVGGTLTVSGTGALSTAGYAKFTGSAIGAGSDVWLGPSGDGGLFLNVPAGEAVAIGINNTPLATIAPSLITCAAVTKVTDTTASTSTSSGALVVGNGTSGGLGVGGNIYAGGDIITTKSNGVIKASGSSANAEVAAERLTLTPSSVSMVAAVSQPQLAFTSDTAGSYTWGRILANSSEIVRVHSANLAAIANVAGAGIAVAGGITSTGNTTISATTASTSTSSGALVVSGGVGVAGAINAGVGTHTFATAAGGSINSFGSLLSYFNIRSTSDSDNPIFRVYDGRVNVSAFEVNARTGNALLAGNITTAAPAGGTAAAWKLGTVATVSPTSPNRTIEVDIGGTIYYIAAKTTNN